MHTQVRITKEYLEKLRKLANTNRRPMSTQIQVLIDNELKRLQK